MAAGPTHLRFRWDLDIALDVDKLPKRRVEREAMHAGAVECHDQLRRRTIHAVAGHLSRYMDVKQAAGS